MKVIVIVHARFGSARLPGKVLKPLHGRPMIAHLFDNLSHCRSVDSVVLATSDQSSDDPVAAVAAASGTACHRGPLDDVASRVLSAARGAGADALVRISGDSPLLDPALVDRAAAMFREGGADLVTNVATRSFPKGQSVEVMACGALARAIVAMTTAAEREHVTAHFYAHPEAFAIRSFAASSPRPDVQLSVDSAEDFAHCEAILDALGQPAWQAGWEACVAASDRLRQRALS